jgi:two-component system sensor histidine kinase VicK
MFKKFKIYASMPEMRLFWLFLFLILFITVVNTFYLPRLWQLISLAVLLSVGLIIFVNSVKTAKTNYELKIERNRLNIIIDGLRDGVIAYDENFKILLFNTAAEQIFDLKRELVINKVFTLDLAKERSFRLLSQALFPSLAPIVVRRSDPMEYPQILDLSFERPERELRTITSRIVDAKGAILGFVKVVRDRTREIQLLRSKSEFITIASHQLRTPLTAVTWAFENLQKENLTLGQKELAATGAQAAGKLTQIVEDLLNVAKIEEGRFGYQFEQINLAEFLNKILAEAEMIAKEYKVGVYLETPKEEFIVITADPQKLGVAITNILDNAIKYNVANGQVVVELGRSKDKPYVLVKIKDTGIGIPPEDMEKLFTKFYRGENVLKVDTTGSGLGLYITKNIIMRHGGQIWAESVLNRGTTVYFTLPTDPKLIPPKEIVYGEE